jgi:hypothetical protein
MTRLHDAYFMTRLPLAVARSARGLWLEQCLEEHENMIDEYFPRSNSDLFVVQPKKGPLININASILWISNVLKCDLENVTFRDPNSKNLKILNFSKRPLSRPPLGPPGTHVKRFCSKIV